MSSYPQAQGNAFRIFVAGPVEIEERPSALSQDLKLFATFWLGGVVFFGTFLA
jgi:hypothetical protein